MGYVVGEDGLSVQDADALDPSTLTPLSPEVISRQATINIGAFRRGNGEGRGFRTTWRRENQRERGEERGRTSCRRLSWKNKKKLSFSFNKPQGRVQKKKAFALVFLIFFFPSRRSGVSAFITRRIGPRKSLAFCLSLCLSLSRVHVSQRTHYSSTVTRQDVT